MRERAIVRKVLFVMVPATDGALFAHLICAFTMFAGSFSALVLRFIAMYHDDPAIIAAILGIIRPVVPVVVLSMLGTFSFGLWLVHLEDLSYTEGKK